uniref:DUS-like FMN-binding domain-containing protein n=1 Tax=Dunaliella tertiolecta TaxID=3047 RepID=A0A7S3R3J5_DUNTE|mmetsp:Transcript_21504/g.59555  ORF Transcript_21504/g.59555 Transcript_21504/m.59555 type:complete len:615 (+) Transcript_21504:51-1895(+)
MYMHVPKPPTSIVAASRCCRHLSTHRLLPNNTLRPVMATTSNAAHNERQLLSVAPMMDWTDVHYRQLARLISRHTWLWTEMVVDKTILNSPHPDRFLWFPKEQRPLVLQVGGSEPESLAAAARVAIEYGYDEINLNCGCPSDRVAGAGCFGASLMLEPELVGDCMRAMGDAASGTPVTVKCRLGVDQDDSYEALHRFVKVVSERSGVRHFIIHARKAFLKGLNPHQNRSVPPLRYEWLFGLKRDFPHLIFSLNGGIQSPYEALAYINHIPDAASTLHQDAGISGNGANKIDEGAHGLNHIANDIIQAANGADEEANGVSEGAAGAAQNGAARSLKRGAEEVADGSREAECSACGGAPGGAAPAESKAAAAATAHDAERMLSHADASTSGAAAPANGGEGANGVSIMANSVHQNGAQDAGSEERGNLAAPVAAHMVPPGVAAVEGVMIGRAAYNDPWGVLGNADKAVFGADSNPAISRRQVLSEYSKYADTMVGSWGCKPDGHKEPSVRTVFKPLLNLFHGEKGSKRWKQEVDALLKTNPPSVEYVLAKSLHLLEQEALDSPPRAEPSMEEALRGRFSATPAPKVVLGPLPRPSDRAGFNQDPNGVDSKRLCMTK